MYLHYTPKLVQWIYPEFLWHHARGEKKIYLTFDDGPVPGVTDFVLNTLNDYKAKATFFCVGENIQKHPGIFQRIIDNGHQVGNHTFNHLNGSKVENGLYLDNIHECDKTLVKFNGKTSNLFRPPYGRLKRSQIKPVAKRFKIVMWDVLSGDFDPSLTQEMCLSKSIKHSTSGTLIVFHDSLKTEKTLRYVLPKYLNHFKEQAYTFEAL